MAQTWTLADIRAKVRAISGELTTEDIENTVLDDRINDFYQNDFAREAYVSDFETWFTASFTDGVGEYAVSNDYLRLETPMTVQDSDDVITNVKFFQDKDAFFKDYPEEVTPTEHRPAAVLLYGNRLYPRPVPDAAYTFKAACKKKPDALTADTAPVDVHWGKAIAYGTALEMAAEDNDDELVNKLTGPFTYFMGKVSEKKKLQKNTNQRAVPRF